MKKFNIEIKWAIIYVFCYLFWMYFENAMGWHDALIAKQPLLGSLFGIIPILIFILAILDKKKNYFKNEIDWKQGFLSGSILALIIALFTPLLQYVSFEIIAPEYFQKLIDLKVAKKTMTLEAAKDYFNLKSYIYMNVFSALSYGIVLSSIIAYALRTKQK